MAGVGRGGTAGCPGAERKVVGAAAWRGGAAPAPAQGWRGDGAERRLEAGGGAGHGGGPGAGPGGRPGGERHPGGVRAAVGRRDGHPGECRTCRGAAPCRPLPKTRGGRRQWGHCAAAAPPTPPAARGRGVLGRDGGDCGQLLPGGEAKKKYIYIPKYPRVRVRQLARGALTASGGAGCAP